ncbi:isochorismate synthase [Stutzerimonas stutzeri]|uniref:isochorismate synthase n=1 Tax=Stutzerimonas stutzeri TaxID=316 RepID=UPI0015E42E3B|nr:isochorismate synthase [Stutzerimonas stutzeri]
MNALTRVAYDGPGVGYKFPPSYRFYSPAGGIEASGCFKAIDTPAEGAGPGLEHDVQRAFAEAQVAGLNNPVLVGVIPFDKQRSSSLFIPRHVSHLPPASPPTAICGFACGTARQCTEQPDQAGFQQAVTRALGALRSGRLDKAVLSRLLQLEFDAPPCAATIFQGLRQQNPEAFHFFTDLPDGGVLIGASPELLLRKTGQRLETNPLAGSARRYADPAADEQSARSLLDSGKDQHEHRLVIRDIERQLRPLCRGLQIPAAPSLMSTAKLWHLSTRIEGELAAPMSALSLACQLHPTPALCGFPTAAAKQLITELEPFDRGVFGGIVGWCDAAGNGDWAVVIRCGVINERKVRLFAGAGLVSASCPESEWRETGTKLGTMLAAFGLDQEAV